MGMVVVVVVVVVVGGIVVVVVVVVVVGTVVDVVDPAATKVVEVVAVGEATGVRDGSTISLGRDSLGVVTVVTSRNSVVGGAVGGDFQVEQEGEDLVLKWCLMRHLCLHCPENSRCYC